MGDGGFPGLLVISKSTLPSNEKTESALKQKAAKIPKPRRKEKVEDMGNSILTQGNSTSL